MIDFADAYRQAREYTMHKRAAYKVLAQSSKDISCPSKYCILYLGINDSKEDYPCACLEGVHSSYADLFKNVICFLNGDYEAILPLAESKRMDDERLERLINGSD